MHPLLALWHGPMSSWSFIDWACFIVAVGAVIAIAVVALRYFGIDIPPELVRIFWILVICVAAIGAIIFIANMIG